MKSSLTYTTAAALRGFAGWFSGRAGDELADAEHIPFVVSACGYRTEESEVRPGASEFGRTARPLAPGAQPRQFFLNSPPRRPSGSAMAFRTRVAAANADPANRPPRRDTRGRQNIRGIMMGTHTRSRFLKGLMASAAAVALVGRTARRRHCAGCARARGSPCLGHNGAARRGEYLG